MIVFAVLAIAFAVVLALQTTRGHRSPRDAARVAMAVAMVFAGVSHFLMPGPFVQHLPEWVPSREAIIYLTGALEVVLGVGLVGPAPYRPLVAVALAAYLLAVFPANVYVAVANVPIEGQPGGVYQWIRLPFQAVFIGWVLWSTPGVRGVLEHPLRALSDARAARHATARAAEPTGRKPSMRPLE